jgi:ABC-2 type transport system permease protein
MNIRRVYVLLGKELRYSSKNFIFVFAVVIPIVLSLVITLLFGSLFSGKPKLGINDQGDSELAAMLVDTDALLSKEYSSDDELREAVESGAVDFGLVIPQQFDTSLKSGDEAQLSGYVWGESLLKNRAAIATSLVVLVREMVGQEVPVEIVSTSLGEGEDIPWEKRIFPFIVFMAIILGGTMVPATSLVDEKQKRTLKALVTTPTTLGEVFTSKGLFGFLVSILVAVLVLFLNQAFGNQPYLLVGVLALSALMAAAFGVLLGAFIKDVNTLFAVIKGMGLLLYAPVFIYLFPGIPEWIGKLFPTYYMIGPIIDISQKDATWAQVAQDVYVLMGLILLLVVLLTFVSRRESAKEV